LAAFREGRGGMGKKKEKLSFDRVGIYRLLPMESPTERVRRYTCQWVRWWMCHVTVRRSQFESLCHSVGKIVWKKSMLSHRCNFSKNYIICRWYDRYILIENTRRYILIENTRRYILMDLLRRYILTELEMELFSSVKITDFYR
jgi:hypothetical protein